MKRFFTTLLLLGSATAILSAQCTTTNAGPCQCADGLSTNCDLLPDITASWVGLLDYIEYSQTSGNTNYNQGPNDGRLRVSVSTPNIGYGPLTVSSSTWYVCGTDTTQDGGLCPDGTYPRQLITQRIYHKNGSSMTYTDRWAGSMTYHPTHGHSHVDDWGTYTLRIKNPNEPDPRKWPIVAGGSKQGFCLMDYYSCSTGAASGHCRDDNTVYQQGNALNSTSNFPNYGLGGGGYNCSPTQQGISSGFTDLYSKALDMMWINIPPGICNGNYWIVVEIDPNQNFLESNEDNNYTAVPITITQQSAPGTNPFATISSNKPPGICEGDSIILTCNAGTSMLWSTGDSTQSIVVRDPGTYNVTVTNYCGVATSQDYVVTVGQAGSSPVVADTSLCAPGSATVSGSADYVWYADSTATSPLGTGATFTTPFLNQTDTFYVREVTQLPNNQYFCEPHNTDFGGGAYTSSGYYLIFDAVSPFTLKSVKVDANSSGTRTIYLRSFANVVIDSVIVNIPQGVSRVTLNFNVPAGNDYRLTASSNPGLYRNAGGVAFPYQVPGILYIKNSAGPQSTGGSYYYYFYDWEVETPGNTCTSAIGNFVVNVGNLAIPTINGLTTEYDVTDADVTLSGTPAGGVFSGQGISGNTFSPALAGPGGPYTITYTYTLNGCSVSTTSTVTVTQLISVNDIEDLKSPIQVYPNPGNGLFTLTFETQKAKDVNLTVVDLTGRYIWGENVTALHGKYNRTFGTNNMASGVYMLNILIDGQRSVRKLVVN